MLELIDELRRRDFTVAIVTGGGTEFVRAISHDLYGVPPEAVVGTLIEYELRRDEDGPPRCCATGRVVGDANEGPAKVSNIQTQLGRRPILGGGQLRRRPRDARVGGRRRRAALALLVDHDDAEREFAYVSKAETFAEAEPITDVGARLGWTIVSMADDWETVFPGLLTGPRRGSGLGRLRQRATRRLVVPEQEGVGRARRSAAPTRGASQNTHS